MRPTAQVEALELKPVERAEQVPVMVHGTYFRLWPAIGAFTIAPSSQFPQI